MDNICLIGVDVGTSATKVVAFDTKGNVLAEHSGEYPLYQPQNGWAEQDPRDWVNAAISGLSAVIKHVSDKKIAGIGVSGQMHGLVMLDEPMGESHMGGAIAAPTFKKIFDEVLRYMDIEPQFTEEDLLIQDKEVPYVVGLPITELGKAFDGTGLKYNILGSGSTVVSQVPVGGANLPDGSTVAVYTEATQDDRVEVPDVRGHTANDANYILTNAGLNMKVSGAAVTDQGTAVVSTQTPTPGTKLQRGSPVTVEFTFSNVH